MVVAPSSPSSGRVGGVHLPRRSLLWDFHPPPASAMECHELRCILNAVAAAVGLLIFE